MPLLEGGVVAPDPWQVVPDDQPVPPHGAVMVSLVRLRTEHATLLARAEPVGARLQKGEGIEPLLPHLGRLALVALPFPVFKDGRSYSLARLLRERHGYTGQLRATGEVLRDQLLFMVRAGFDAFEVPTEAAAAWWTPALSEMSAYYQPSARRDEPVVGVLRQP